MRKEKKKGGHKQNRMRDPLCCTVFLLLQEDSMLCVCVCVCVLSIIDTPWYWQCRLSVVPLYSTVQLVLDVSYLKLPHRVREWTVTVLNLHSLFLLLRCTTRCIAGVRRSLPLIIFYEKRKCIICGTIRKQTEYSIKQWKRAKKKEWIVVLRMWTNSISYVVGNNLFIWFDLIWFDLIWFTFTSYTTISSIWMSIIHNPIG